MRCMWRYSRHNQTTICNKQTTRRERRKNAFNNVECWPPPPPPHTSCERIIKSTPNRSQNAVHASECRIGPKMSVTTSKTKTNSVKPSLILDPTSFFSVANKIKKMISSKILCMIQLRTETEQHTGVASHIRQHAAAEQIALRVGPEQVFQQLMRMQRGRGRGQRAGVGVVQMQAKKQWGPKL